MIALTFACVLGFIYQYGAINIFQNVLKQRIQCISDAMLFSLKCS